MVNILKIKKERIDYFERMIEDIEIGGRTHLCPNWDNSLIEETNVLNRCNPCQKYFKRLKNKFWKCPCSLYTPDYLIRFLKKVISNSIEGED